MKAILSALCYVPILRKTRIRSKLDVRAICTVAFVKDELNERTFLRLKSKCRELTKLNLYRVCVVYKASFGTKLMQRV